MIFNTTTQRCRAASEAMRFLHIAVTGVEPFSGSGKQAHTLWRAEASLRLCVVALKPEGRGARGFATGDDPVQPKISIRRKLGA
jgi:hypothetical protein